MIALLTLLTQNVSRFFGLLFIRGEGIGDIAYPNYISIVL